LYFIKAPEACGKGRRRDRRIPGPDPARLGPPLPPCEAHRSPAAARARLMRRRPRGFPATPRRRRRRLAPATGPAPARRSRGQLRAGGPAGPPDRHLWCRA